jgi:hypothetical protein
MYSSHPTDLLLSKLADEKSRKIGRTACARENCQLLIFPFFPRITLFTGTTNPCTPAFLCNTSLQRYARRHLGKPKHATASTSSRPLFFATPAERVAGTRSLPTPNAPPSRPSSSSPNFHIFIIMHILYIFDPSILFLHVPLCCSLFLVSLTAVNIIYRVSYFSPMLLFLPFCVLLLSFIFPRPVCHNILYNFLLSFHPSSHHPRLTSTISPNFNLYPHI